MNTAQDHIYGWATPGATVKVHAHGVFIRDIGTDASGRWWTHLGFERGNTTVEAQQRVVGRPWSGWSRMVVQQLPQMPPPSINYIDSSHYWVSRKRRTRSNSKSTCSWCCNKRRWSRPEHGNWATHIGRQDPNRRIEAQQYRLRKTMVWLDRNKCCRKICRA